MRVVSRDRLMLLLDSRCRRRRRNRFFLQACLVIPLVCCFATVFLRARGAWCGRRALHLLFEPREAHPGGMAIGDFELRSDEVPVNLVLLALFFLSAWLGGNIPTLGLAA